MSIIKKNSQIDEEKVYSIVVTDEINSLNECYNTLKDNLLFMSGEGKNQVIQIESSFESEGKTTMACNLAVSLSFNKKKVLVVDLDFRRPRANRCFNVSNENGLVDYISEKITLEKTIKKTAYDGVDIVTRGSSIFNPSYLLTSERFKQFVLDMRKLYDYILLDSPPILQISDYVHISKVSDGVLLVVKYGKTKKAQIKDVAGMLKKSEINVIGTVMTFVDRKDPYAYHNNLYSYAESENKK